jgi:hypothetical protein
MKLRAPFLFALGLSLALAAPAPAVIIDSGNGTGNVTAPSPDPGWGNVGSCNGLSCVYLGDGWVLTANHVGAGNGVFGGITYPWVPGSDLQLHNPNNSLADLRMFEIYPPYPPLPALTISSIAPLAGTSLILIGNGRDRGAATSWDPDPGPPPSSIDGYFWALTGSKRWGTNTVQLVPELPVFESDLGTQLFATVFDQSGTNHTTHESQAAVGDSGGAAFAWNGSSYELAGILIAISTFQNQPAETALYGNYTLPADLSVYRNEIVATMPEPAGGLWIGLALVAALARRRLSAAS